jgi:multimeric flavodoxin WrbA
MKKVTAIIGTESKKATYKAISEFEKVLKKKDEIEFEYVFLNDYNLGFCKGCKACFLKGEEFCPVKDDRDTLIEKLENSDGVIFASPNYAFGASARIKNFIDRMAFIMHRPRFFNKTFTAVVVQGVYGGKDVQKFLESTGVNLGFDVTKGCCLTTLDPITPPQQKKLVSEVGKTADRFYKNMMKPAYVPSVYSLALFRLSRSNIKNISEDMLDYRYYQDHGWFESDYYYPVSLGLPRKAVGKTFDFLAGNVLKMDRA